jgi:hypothetical protein
LSVRLKRIHQIDPRTVSFLVIHEESGEEVKLLSVTVNGEKENL